CRVQSGCVRNRNRRGARSSLRRARRNGRHHHSELTCCLSPPCLLISSIRGGRAWGDVPAQVSARHEGDLIVRGITETILRDDAKKKVEGGSKGERRKSGHACG